MAINTGYSATGNLRQGLIPLVDIAPAMTVKEAFVEGNAALQAARDQQYLLRNREAIKKLDDMVIQGKITKQEADDAKNILSTATDKAAMANVEVKAQADNANARSQIVDSEQNVLTKPLTSQVVREDAQRDIDQKAILDSMKANSRNSQDLLSQLSGKRYEGSINRLPQTEQVADLTAENDLLTGRKNIAQNQADMELLPTVQSNKKIAAESTAAKYAAIKAAGGTLRTPTSGGGELIEYINPKTGEIETDKIAAKVLPGAVANNPKFTQEQEKVVEAAESQLADIDRAEALLTGKAVGADGKLLGTAQTGYFSKWTPSFRQATVDLESIAARLGIDATKALKGAISLRELELARSSTLSPNNSEEVNLMILKRLKKVVEAAKARADLRIELAALHGREWDQAQLTKAVFDAIPDTVGAAADPFENLPKSGDPSSSSSATAAPSAAPKPKFNFQTK